jgi:hypothetical protein
MRHIFRQPPPVLFLAHFVIQPARLRLLVQRPRPTLLLRACHRRTPRAIPVAAVATPADHHLRMTTFAVENPAIVVAHPKAPTKGLYTGQPEERCSRRASKLAINLFPIVQEVRAVVPDLHPLKTLTPLSHTALIFTTGLIDGPIPPYRRASAEDVLLGNHVGEHRVGKPLCLTSGELIRGSVYDRRGGGVSNRRSHLCQRDARHIGISCPRLYRTPVAVHCRAVTKPVL